MGAVPDPEPGSAGLSTRRAILLALRRDGPASADRLAAALGISRTAMLQQLRSLARAGLIVRHAVRHGVGRPRHVYDLTQDAQGTFPDDYDSLSVDLVRALEQVGGRQLVEAAFQARRGRLAESIRERFAQRGLAEAPLAERVRELARVQDERGYLCDCVSRASDGDEATSSTAGAREAAAASEPIAVEQGAIRLREHNCAIYDVATITPAACRAEVQLFRDVLGARVVRETHIAAGDRCCTYRVEAAPEPRRAVTRL